MVTTQKLAPVCLFTYNRLIQTVKTIEALKANYLASDTDLIMFSDGGKDNETKLKVNEVREYLKKVTGFKSITIYKAQFNKGLAHSIIDGVTQEIEKYGKVIVLEDDLVTTPNFLDYMNQALNFYEYNDKLISICAYGLKIEKPIDYQNDFYLYGRSSSWGC